MNLNYGILGVPVDASSEEIKDAYRKLASVFYVTKSPDSDTIEKFAKVKAAYRALTNTDDNDLLLFVTNAILENASDNQFTTSIAPDNSLENKFSRETIVSKILTILAPSNIQTARTLLENSDDEILISIFIELDKTYLSKTETGQNTVPYLDTVSQFPYANLSDTEIINKINEAKDKYQDENIIDHHLEPAFMWLATKPGCAPVYLIATCHKRFKNPADYFGQILAKILSEVSNLYTEVPVSFRTSIEIPYKNGTRTCYLYEGMLQEMAVKMQVQVKNLETSFTRRFCTDVGEFSLPQEQPSSSTIQMATEFYLNHISTSHLPIEVEEHLKSIFANI